MCRYLLPRLPLFPRISAISRQGIYPESSLCHSAGRLRWHTEDVTSEELLERISIDPAVCHGQPCIRGTRVLVTVLLDALAGGMTTAEIVEHYPSIAEDDVRAAAAYGAWLAKQEVHALSHGS